MKIAKFTQNDRLVSFYARLLDANGEAVDLTGQTVAFTMESEAGVKKIDAQAAVVLQTGTSPNFTQKGEVRYDWGATDTDTAGLYYGWIVRTETATSKKATHPLGGQGQPILIEAKP